MLKKTQNTFILLLILALVVFQGKAIFRILSRYSSISAKRFSPWYVSLNDVKPETIDYFLSD